MGNLLHGNAQVIYADAGTTGAPQRPEVSGVSAVWRIAAKRNAVAQLAEGDDKDALKHDEHLKARMRAGGAPVSGDPAPVRLPDGA